MARFLIPSLFVLVAVAAVVLGSPLSGSEVAEHADGVAANQTMDFGEVQWAKLTERDSCTDNLHCGERCCWDSRGNSWYCCGRDKGCCPQQTSNGCCR